MSSNLLQQAAELIACNCGDTCDGTCLHAELLAEAEQAFRTTLTVTDTGLACDCCLSNDCECLEDRCPECGELASDHSTGEFCESEGE